MKKMKLLILLQIAFLVGIVVFNGGAAYQLGIAESPSTLKAELGLEIDTNPQAYQDLMGEMTLMADLRSVSTQLQQGAAPEEIDLSALNSIESISARGSVTTEGAGPVNVYVVTTSNGAQFALAPNGEFADIRGITEATQLGGGAARVAIISGTLQGEFPGLGRLATAATGTPVLNAAARNLLIYYDRAETELKVLTNLIALGNKNAVLSPFIDTRKGTFQRIQLVVPSPPPGQEGPPGYYALLQNPQGDTALLFIDTKEAGKTQTPSLPVSVVDNPPLIEDLGKMLALPNLRQRIDIITERIHEAENRGEVVRTAPTGEYQGLLFDPGYAISQRENLSYEAVAAVTRTPEEVIALIAQAKEPLEVIMHLRGVDGPGSSLDLPEFQRILTEQGAKGLSELPSTPTLASEFSVRVSFGLARNPNTIEYVAPDYGITEDNPYVVNVVNSKGEVEFTNFDNNGNVIDGQKGAPAYILAHVFGLRGIRIYLEDISPMAIAGGMESSNAFNVALYSAASALSGANWTLADIFAEAVRAENWDTGVLGGLTGGQGHLSSMLGGAYRHIWLSGVKNAQGEFINPYGAFSIPFLNKEDYPRVESRMALVQAGVEFENGEPVIGRTAALINMMWTQMLRTHDNVAYDLHQNKLALADQYVRGLQQGDMDAVIEAVNKFVDIRDTIAKRWAQVVVEEGRKDLLEELEPRDRKALVVYGLSPAKRKAVESTLKTIPEKKLNELALGNLEKLYKAHISLYTDTAKELIMLGRENGIAMMPLGAGGPGANIIAIAKEPGALERFFAEQGVPRLVESDVRDIVRGSGYIKGYMPFKIGKEPIQFKGFRELGLQEPALPEPVQYSEATGVFRTAATGEVPAAMYQLEPAQIKQLDAEENVVGQADSADVLDYLKLQQLQLAGVAVAENAPATVEEARSMIQGLTEELKPISVPQGDIRDEAEVIQPISAGREAIVVPISAEQNIALVEPAGTYKPVNVGVVNQIVAKAEQTERGAILIDFNTLARGIRTRKDGSRVMIPNDFAMKAIALLNNIKSIQMPNGQARYRISVYSDTLTAEQMNQLLGALAVPFDGFIQLGTAQIPTVADAVAQVADEQNISQERVVVTLAEATVKKAIAEGRNIIGRLAKAVNIAMVKTPKIGDYVSYKSMLLNSLRLLEGVLNPSDIAELRNQIETAPVIRGTTIEPEKDEDKAVSRMQAAVAV